MSEVGRGAYLANLEKARKALLDRAGTQYKTESAQEQLQDVKEGLMRPRARPEVEVDGPSEGIGLGLMRALSDSKKAQETTVSEQAPEKSIRPHSRAQGRHTITADQMQIYEGLLKRGMEPHIAQGFMSNFRDESAFKLDVEEAEANVHGTFGKGLYQRTGSRRASYEEQNGNDWSIDTQLDALMVELETSEKGAWGKIKNTKTAGEAGAAIVTDFLRPAAKHRRARVASYMDGSGLWSN
jgi:hypothetical protein